MIEFKKLPDAIRELHSIDFSKLDDKKNSVEKKELERIESMTKMPFCGEQVLLILLALLNLREECKVNKIHLSDNKKIELNYDYIKSYVSALLPLFNRESNHQICDLIKPMINNFGYTKNFEQLQSCIKKIVREHIISIDIAAIMKHSMSATENKETAGMNLIVLVGKTGAGKSTLLHDLSGTQFKEDKTLGRLIVKKVLVEKMNSIEIGQKTTSETTKTTVVPVDKIPSLKKFHTKEIVLCDTPGFGDNREALGDEIKIINGLEIVAPLKKGNSVRFLVLLSADTHNARSETLRETLDSVSKLFINERALKDACPAIVYVYTGDTAKDRREAIINDIKDSIENKKTLGYSNGVEILLNDMKKKFSGKASNIPLIRPLKSWTTKSQELMKKIMESDPITDPENVLTPYTEKSCIDSLSKQLKFHQDSITNILDRLNSIEDLLSKEITSSLIALLVRKIIELIFMDARFPIDTNYLDQCIESLVKISREIKGQLIKIICPKNHVVNSTLLDQAKEGYKRLKLLDSLISGLITKEFFVNRERVIPFINKLKIDKAVIKLPDNYKALDENEWELFLLKNRPSRFVEQTEKEIIIYRDILVDKLKEIINFQGLEIEHNLSQRLWQAQQEFVLPITNGTAISLKLSDEVRLKHVKNALNVFNKSKNIGDLKNIIEEINVDFSKKKEIICQSEDALSKLSTISQVLSIQKQHFSDIISGAKNENILEEQFDALNNIFAQWFERAAFIDDFVVMVQIIERADHIANMFGFVPQIEEFKKQYIAKLETFVQSAIDLLKSDSDEMLQESEIKQIIYSMVILQEMKKDPLFKQYFLNTGVGTYQQGFELNFSKLSLALISRFTKQQQLIDGITNCKNDITGFEQLTPLLQQMWYLLSIPHDYRDSWLETYHQIIVNISKYTQHFCSQFVGQLDRDDAVENDVYTEIKNYLTQLKAAKWMSLIPLSLSTTEGLTQAVTMRANRLIAWTDAVDLRVEQAENILKNDWLLEEMNTISHILKDFLPSDIIDNMNQSRSRYFQRILDALNGIEKEMDAYQSHLPDSLNIENLKHGYQYLTINKEKNFNTSKIENIEKLIQEFFEKYTTEKNRNIDEILQLLIPEKADLSEINISILNATFDEYEQLKNQVPAYYAMCGNPLENWRGRLSQLVAQYNDVLTSQLRDATSSTHDVNLTNALLKRCEQLQPLDDFIKRHHPSEEKPLTFKKLHKRFSHAFESEHFPKLSAVMKEVYAGNFEKAIQVSLEEIEPNSPLRKVLVPQIDMYVGAMIDKTEKMGEQLIKNPSAQPAIMSEFMKNIASLNFTEKLIGAQLLSEEWREKRHKVLLKAQENLDQWFVLVIGQINENGNNLDFKTATTLLADLRKTVEAMSTQPTDYNIHFQRSEDMLLGIIKACHDQFTQPITEWAKQKYKLEAVCQAFFATSDMSIGDKHYNQEWKTISSTIYKAVEQHCEFIKSQLQSGKQSVSQAIDSLLAISFIVGETKVEETKLVERIKLLCVETLNAFQDIILSRSSSLDENVLKEINDLLSKKADCEKFLGSIDFSRALSCVKTRVEELSQSIESALSNNSIPQAELHEFILIYDQLGNQYAFLKEAFEDHKTQAEKLVNSVIKKMREGISQYSLGTNIESAISELNIALQNLLSIQGLVLSKKTSKLLTMNLNDQVIELLTQIKELLSNNNRKFNEALKSHDMIGLGQALTTAQSFQPITLSIEKYIQECNLSPLPEKLVELKQLNSDFSYKKLCEKVYNEINRIIKELSEFNANRLPSSGATGETIRQQFYQRMRNDLIFIEDISSLSEHLEDDLFSHAIDEDYGYDKCITAISTFLASIYRLALQQLDKIPSVDVSWHEFGCFYQELMIFKKECGGHKSLDELTVETKQLQLLESNKSKSTPTFNWLTNRVANFLSSNSGTVTAPQIANHLEKQFADYVKKIIDDHKNEFFSGSHSDEKDTLLVTFLAGMQKMIDELPMLAKTVKEALGKFLLEIANKRGHAYMSYLAGELRKEEFGYGATLINDQTCFSGMAIAMRNLATEAHGIDYVLDKMELRDSKTGHIIQLSGEMRDSLKDFYEEFDEKYQELIEKNLKPGLDFDGNGENLLKNLLNDLNQILKNNPVLKDTSNKIIWDERATSKIPALCAYLFAIWTLRDSKAYFEATDAEDNKNYLKKPHAAQVIAIMTMLNITNPEEGLLNHFPEVLTGEGKSIVIAVTASILALLGFAVDAGCYSQYLSDRDFADFENMFQFLEIDQYIQYGTFNKLSESMLNQKGDLRKLVKSALFNSICDPNDLEPKPDHGREVIAISDEVDALVRALFGYLYQPYFLLKNDEVTALINLVWQKHQEGRVNINAIRRSQEYKACVAEHKDLEFLFEHALNKMIADLKKYKVEEGHEYYVDAQGQLYYRFYDGTTNKQSLGYKTLWACKADNRISSNCLTEHLGLIVPCGAFSYVDLITTQDRYRAILGVTGTLRELSPTERDIVEKDFRVQRQSYLPSAYGPRKLSFNKKSNIQVVEDSDYDNTLTNEIKKRLIGTSDPKARRAVIVFFDTIEELEAYQHSTSFLNLNLSPSEINLMTPNTITNSSERNAAIRRATHSGKFTSAPKEYGRGNDFICYDPKVLANGGIHVIDAGMPEDASTERQDQGRAARQGQDGSYSMVLKKSKLIKQFDVTDEEIEEARSNENLYEFLVQARDDKFEQKHQSIVEDLNTTRTELHEPSLKFLEIVRTYKPGEDKTQLIEALKKTLPETMTVQSTVSRSRILILIDSTGSMSALISACKETLSKAVENLENILLKNGFDEKTFKIQIGAYKDYYDGKDVLRCSDWTCDVNELQNFIETIKATGGNRKNGNEAIEVGLFHANSLINEGLTQVILIGDMRPHHKSEIEETRNSQHSGFWPTSRFNEAQHYKVETQKLNENDIPIYSFFTPGSSTETQKTFRKMADKTGGQAKELNLDQETGVEAIRELLGTHIIQDVVKGDKTRAAKLYAQYIRSFTS